MGNSVFPPTPGVETFQSMLIKLDASAMDFPFFNMKISSRTKAAVAFRKRFKLFTPNKNETLLYVTFTTGKYFTCDKFTPTQLEKTSKEQNPFLPLIKWKDSSRSYV